MNKVQQVELEILVNFDQFASENGLQYFLYAGTFLGAVRHKGFIPWDDDTDVGMRRREFEKFEKLFIKSNYLKNQFIYQSRKIDKYLAFPFSKIRSDKIPIYELTSKTQKNNIGPWLDVFPFDNIPDDNRLRKTQFDKVSFYNKLIRLFLLTNTDNTNGIKNKVKCIIQKSNEKFYKQYFFLPFLFRQRDKYMQMYNNIETEASADLCYMYYENFEHYSTCIYKNSDLADLVYYDFEGWKFKAPKNYDRILSSTYGDYMTIPDVDNRKTHKTDYIY